jgi:hypothetical protein
MVIEAAENVSGTAAADQPLALTLTVSPVVAVPLRLKEFPMTVTALFEFVRSQAAWDEDVIDKPKTAAEMAMT